MGHKKPPPPPRVLKPAKTPAAGARRLRQAAYGLGQALARNLQTVRKARH